MTMIRRTLPALLLAVLLAPAASALEDEDYIGSIELVGFPYCPENSLPAWGQVLSVDPNFALHALLGNRFGGDASNGNFALPDLRPHTPKGMTYCVVFHGLYPAQQ